MGTTEITECKIVYIDTSLYIYAFQSSSDFHTKSLNIFKALENKFIQINSSSVTLVELLQHEKVQKNKPLHSKIKNNFFSTPNLKFTYVDEIVSELSAYVAYKYTLSLPDAIHISTAILNKCDLFITNDKKLVRVKDINVAILSEIKI